MVTDDYLVPHKERGPSFPQTRYRETEAGTTTIQHNLRGCGRLKVQTSTRYIAIVYICMQILFPYWGQVKLPDVDLSLDFFDVEQTSELLAVVVHTERLEQWNKSVKLENLDIK